MSLHRWLEKGTLLNRRRPYVPCLEMLETRLAPATAINILGTGVGSLDAIFAAHHGTILSTDGANGGTQAETLSAAALKSASATTNISITAQTAITFNDLGAPLALQTGLGHSDSFTVTGPITFSNTANKLTTNGGTLTFSAGTDLTVANLSAGGGSINLVAGTNAEGSVSARALLTSGAGNVTIQATNAVGPSDVTQIGLLTGHAVHITATDTVVVDQIKGTSVTLTSNTGSIDSAVASPIQSSGALTLSAAAGITVNSRAASLQATNSTSGDIFVTQAAAPTQALTTFGSGVINDASGGIIDITDLGSAIIVAAGAPIATSNGAITLLATDFTILGAIDSGTAITTLGNAQAGTPINLGANNVAGKISLTQTELQFVTAGLLHIGTPTAGPIAISQPIIVPASVNGNLQLNNNGPITESTAPAVGSLTATNLAISSAGPVTLSNVNDVMDVSSSTTGSFAINNGTNTLTIPGGGIDGVAGISTVNSNITLEADNLVINQAVSPGSSNITANTVLLEPFTTTLNITLGTASVANATFGLTDVELGWIASGIAKIGVGADTGTITITAAITRMASDGVSRSQTLFLVTGNSSLNPLVSSITGAITQLPGDTLSVANLATQSVGGVRFNSVFNDVDTIADDVTGATTASNFRFLDAPSGALTVGTVAGIAGITVASGNFLEVRTLGALTLTNGLRGNVIGLNAGGAATQSSGSAITGGTLLLLGVGPYALTNTNTKNNVSTLFASVTNSVSYTNAGNLAVGSIFTNFADGFGGASGISSASGTIAVNTINGNLTLNDTVSAGGVNAVVTLTAGDTGSAHTTLTNNTTITGTAATLVADRMVLDGGAINVGAAAANILSLQPFSAGRTIDVGGAGDPLGTLQLSQVELATITSGILRIGTPSAGNLTLTAAISGAGHFATLTLLTHGVIAQTGAGAVTVANLDAVGAGGVALATNANTVSNALAGSTANQSFAFTNSTSLTVGTADTQSGINAGSGAVKLNGGTFALTANNQISATSTLRLSGATLNLGAFSDSVALLAMSSTGTLGVRLNAFSAGNFGALTVKGAINLGNATLNLTVGAGFVKPAAGTSIVLIRNTPNVAVVGKFAGLAEGAAITVGAFHFRISYVGGAGHDVTLTAM